MKLFAMALLICLSSVSLGQSLKLDVTYTRSENDLNKSKRTEMFSISGRSSSYSLEYEGKVMPGEMNEAGGCEPLSDYAYQRIIKSINDNKLNVNEAVYRKERLGGEGIFYLTISVGLVLDGVPYSISIDGEANLVMDSKIYLNVINLIKDLRKILREC
jgi:hypothetical protein